MKIGVYVCECGVNIAATVNVEKVAEQVKSLPNVVVSRYYKYMCSDPGQELIKKDIKELKLDRVIVASCSPRMHEPTFRGAIEEAGLNGYCLEMANIREQCSWVHKDKEKGTIKAIAKESMALLLNYDWPGNVRELENVIERALTLGRDQDILPEDLPSHFTKKKAVSLIHDEGEEDMAIEEVEARHIAKILKKTKGNRMKAAGILGIDRRTLYRKIKKYKLLFH